MRVDKVQPPEKNTKVDHLQMYVNRSTDERPKNDRIPTLRMKNYSKSKEYVGSMHQKA